MPVIPFADLYKALQMLARDPRTRGINIYSVTFDGKDKGRQLTF